MYTYEQEKRGLCPYDDKRYLFTDIPDVKPNLYTHVYGHRDQITEVNLVSEYLEPGAELVIRQLEERFKSRHALVIRRF